MINDDLGKIYLKLNIIINEIKFKNYETSKKKLYKLKSKFYILNYLNNNELINMIDFLECLISYYLLEYNNKKGLKNDLLKWSHSININLDDIIILDNFGSLYNLWNKLELKYKKFEDKIEIIDIENKLNKIINQMNYSNYLNYENSDKNKNNNFEKKFINLINSDINTIKNKKWKSIYYENKQIYYINYEIHINLEGKVFLNIKYSFFNKINKNNYKFLEMKLSFGAIIKLLNQTNFKVFINYFNIKKISSVQEFIINLVENFFYPNILDFPKNIIKPSIDIIYNNFIHEEEIILDNQIYYYYIYLESFNNFKILFYDNNLEKIKLWFYLILDINFLFKNILSFYYNFKFQNSHIKYWEDFKNYEKIYRYFKFIKNHKFKLIWNEMIKIYFKIINNVTINIENITFKKIYFRLNKCNDIFTFLFYNKNNENKYNLIIWDRYLNLLFYKKLFNFNIYEILYFKMKNISYNKLVIAFSIIVKSFDLVNYNIVVKIIDKKKLYYFNFNKQKCEITYELIKAKLEILGLVCSYYCEKNKLIKFFVYIDFNDWINYKENKYYDKKIIEYLNKVGYDKINNKIILLINNKKYLKGKIKILKYI